MHTKVNSNLVNILCMSLIHYEIQIVHKYVKMYYFNTSVINNDTKRVTNTSYIYLTVIICKKFSDQFN